MQKRTQAIRNLFNIDYFGQDYSCEGIQIRKNNHKKKTGKKVYGTHFLKVNFTSVPRKFPKDSHDDDDHHNDPDDKEEKGGREEDEVK